jgi:Ca2+-binding EF-hand superfamily protein
MEKQINSMKINSSPMVLAMRLIAGCLLANSIPLCAQNTVFISANGPPPDGTNVTMAAGGGVGICINGMDIGTILLKACDQNQDGKVTLAELENTADNYFKLWDTNSDGELSTNELSTGLQGLFPPPPQGGAQAIAVVDGVAMQIPVDQIRTPDQMIAANLMAEADANSDGSLSLQELNDWLNKSFSQWDQNGDGALDASELGAAFGQLARPNP